MTDNNAKSCQCFQLIPRIQKEESQSQHTHYPSSDVGLVNKTHIFTFLSLPPLATLSPTKSTQYTSSVCPGKSMTSLPLAKLHNLSVESLEAETSCLESELKLNR